MGGCSTCRSTRPRLMRGCSTCLAFSRSARARMPLFFLVSVRSAHSPTALNVYLTDASLLSACLLNMGSPDAAWLPNVHLLGSRPHDAPLGACSLDAFMLDTRPIASRLQGAPMLGALSSCPTRLLAAFGAHGLAAPSFDALCIRLLGMYLHDGVKWSSIQEAAKTLLDGRSRSHGTCLLDTLSANVQLPDALTSRTNAQLQVRLPAMLPMLLVPSVASLALSFIVTRSNGCHDNVLHSDVRVPGLHSCRCEIVTGMTNNATGTIPTWTLTSSLPIITSRFRHSPPPASLRYRLSIESRTRLRGIAPPESPSSPRQTYYASSRAALAVALCAAAIASVLSYFQETSVRGSGAVSTTMILMVILIPGVSASPSEQASSALPLRETLITLLHCYGVAAITPATWAVCSCQPLLLEPQKA